ncbi:MAG: hypothetical protein MIO90_03005, partial [Methanomassiliicoccales archaeon]|nr:hypothetical protein [Methanomassiliicoccales archaeon]
MFHSLAEIFSIIIATTISILAWNSRKRIDNDYLLVIGIAFLAIAAVDLLHTLAFKGMNIFIGYDSNLPTQLWIVARYGQALTMLVAPLFLTRRANVLRVSVTAYAITAVLLLLIFHRLFFDCYVEGSGLTTFKVASEYVIIAVLFGAILYL